MTDNKDNKASENWIETAVVYQVFPLTFNYAKSATNKENDHDGAYGNIKGITQKLAHISKVGADTVWLSPVFMSNLKNGFGYKATNHNEIHPVFGTWDDMRELVHEAHKLGIRIITDQVYNHTAQEHKWFEASKNKSHPEHEKYKDFYVWAKPIIGGLNDDNNPYNIVGGDNDIVRLYPLVDHSADINGQDDSHKYTPLKNHVGRHLYPPNNWLQVDVENPLPAWSYDKKRDACYMHSFHHTMPDLNLNNPAVRAELLKTSELWLNFPQQQDNKYSDVIGVDGFRLDAVAIYGHDPHSNQSMEVWRAKRSGFYHQLDTDNNEEKGKKIAAAIIEINTLVESFLSDNTSIINEIISMDERMRHNIALDLLIEPNDFNKMLENFNSDNNIEVMDSNTLHRLKDLIRDNPGRFISNKGIPSNLWLKEERARKTNNKLITEYSTYGREGLKCDHSFGHRDEKYIIGHEHAQILLHDIMALAEKQIPRKVGSDCIKPAILGEVLCPGDPAAIVNNMVKNKLLHVGYTPVLDSKHTDHHKDGLNLYEVRQAINHGMNNSIDRTGKGVQWALEGHDMIGISKRWNLKEISGLEEKGTNATVTSRMKLLNIMLACLPGSICIFQGQALGVTQPYNKAAISGGRDPLHLLDDAEADMDLRRAAIVWDDEDSSSTRFIHPTIAHQQNPADKQYEDPNSPFNNMKTVLEARHKDPVLNDLGTLTFLQSDHDNQVLSFVRTNNDGDTRLCLLNFSEHEVTIKFDDHCVETFNIEKHQTLPPLSSNIYDPYEQNSPTLDNDPELIELSI